MGRWTHLLLLHADAEITLVEFIRDVPSQSSKFPPLLHKSMEETEPKEKLAPDLRLVTALKEGGVRDRVIQIGTEEVGPQPFWRFICHLHSCRENQC